MQEEERLKQDKTESAHLASTSKNKGKRNNKDNKVAANVLKTGPDRPVRPVEPPTGQLSGSVRLKEPFCGRTGIKPFKPPVEPPNRTNRPVFHEPAKPSFSNSTKICSKLKGPLSIEPIPHP